MIRARIALGLIFSTIFCSAPAQTTSSPALTPGEAHTTRAFDAAKKVGTGELYAFLKPMPKGADLHMHLSGAVYAETFLAEAVKQSLCVDPEALKLAPPPCKSPLLPAATAVADQPLYDKLIDAMSMRSYIPSSGWSGHDQFFATFPRWDALKNEAAGEWLDEVATRAAAQNEQYLEIMQTPSFGHAAQLGYKIGWPADSTSNVTAATLAKLRDKLFDAGLRDEVSVDEKEFADAKASRAEREEMGADNGMGCPVKRQAAASIPIGDSIAGRHSGACDITIHWLYQILRGFPPQQVFAQTLLGFEVASTDPDVVGINFVMPEDGSISMKDYHLQMQMLDYLHSAYPNVRISLHAGELAPGLVPPDGLSFHIREAIDLGHASRIGHGVDVLYENNAPALLKEMADKHIMVEINLTSNDGILGIKGREHPLAAYRAAHVPVALSTDDEGVSRTDLTHEYVRGAQDQSLSYIDLKNMARTSLEHAFFQGESLWSAHDDFVHRKPACSAPITPTSTPAPRCAELLKASERATQQWEMERRFAAFEASPH
jgi:adenosine deaminase